MSVRTFNFLHAGVLWRPRTQGNQTNRTALVTHVKSFNEKPDKRLAITKAQVRQAPHFHSSKKKVYHAYKCSARDKNTRKSVRPRLSRVYLPVFFSNLIQIFSRLNKSFVNGKAGIKPDQGRRVNAPHVRRVFLSKTIFFSPLSFYMHASVLGELRTWKTGPHWPSHARSYHIYEVVQWLRVQCRWPIAYIDRIPWQQILEFSPACTIHTIRKCKQTLMRTSGNRTCHMCSSCAPLTSLSPPRLPGSWDPMNLLSIRRAEMSKV